MHLVGFTIEITYIRCQVRVWDTPCYSITCIQNCPYFRSSFQGFSFSCYLYEKKSRGKSWELPITLLPVFIPSAKMKYLALHFSRDLLFHPLILCSFCLLHSFSQSVSQSVNMVDIGSEKWGDPVNWLLRNRTALNSFPVLTKVDHDVRVTIRYGVGNVCGGCHREQQSLYLLCNKACGCETLPVVFRSWGLLALDGKKTR